MDALEILVDNNCVNLAQLNSWYPHILYTEKSLYLLYGLTLQRNYVIIYAILFIKITFNMSI